MWKSVFSCTLLLLLGVGVALQAPRAGAQASLDKTGVLWVPMEWSLSNPGSHENPYDVIGTATFRHQASGETHATEMFYDGGSTWKFRFTGTREGVWTLSTHSDDPDLSQKSGRIEISANNDPLMRGFLQTYENKFAIQSGDGGAKEGFLMNVYKDMTRYPTLVNDLSNMEDVDDYLDDAAKYGFNTIFVSVMHNWFKYGALTSDDHSNTDPDRKTFEVLEDIIQRAHTRGMRIHILAWGDEEGLMTPINAGGINGEPDKRVQRYIAARLGPLPGWTMAYGADLHEWTDVEKVNDWVRYMHNRMGWDHLLSAPGFNLTGQNVIDSYESFGRNVPLTTSSGGPKSFQEVAQDIDSDKIHPHLYEERHTYLRPGYNLNATSTRRLIWWTAMAGGVGGFYGFFPVDSAAYGGSSTYPNIDQLKTAERFWDKRFLLDMKRSTISDGHAIRSDTGRHYVFYKEDTASVRMDLAGMAGNQSAIAVDTRLAYTEIPLGTLQPASQTWDAPYMSDWTIAVGNFGATSPPGGPCNRYNPNDPAPQGYGLSWNPLTVARELLVNTNCNHDGTVTFKVGSGEGRKYIQYLYKGAHVYTGSSWTPITLFGNAAQGSADWLIGEGVHTSAQVPAGDFFWVGYVCQWTDPTWKCGCRDQQCTTQHWQLQRARR